MWFGLLSISQRCFNVFSPVDYSCLSPFVLIVVTLPKNNSNISWKDIAGFGTHWNCCSWFVHGMSLLQILWILFWWRVHGFSHIFLYLWYQFFGKLMPFLWKFGGNLVEVWWKFGGSLAAVWWQFQSLHLQVKGETKTATKLPPNFHQTSTKLPPNCHQTSTKLPPNCHETSIKMPPNCHQISKKHHNFKKEHQGSTKYVPKIELCSMRFQDSKNHCLPFFCGVKGFVNVKVMRSFLCLQCSWLYSMRTLWQFDVAILFY